MRFGWPVLGLLLVACEGAEEQPDDATPGTGGNAETSSGTSGSEPSTTSAAATSTGSPTTGPTTGSSAAPGSTEGGDSSESGTPPPSNLTPGCGMPATGDVLDGVIDVNRESREYLIEIPDDYDPNTPYPIIFGFHGDSSDNAQAQSSYRLFEYYEGQAIVVYPNGSGAGGSPAWDPANGGDDIDLVIALAQEIGLEMCFDLNRVYAYGYSRGAAMSHAVGCYRGDLFSGIGASSGWAPSTGLCQRPIAIFQSHGLSDSAIPYVSGTNARDAWAEYNGCSGETVELEQAGCVEYTDCDATAPVQWCEFDGGHQFNTIYAQAAVALFRSL